VDAGSSSRGGRGGVGQEEPPPGASARPCRLPAAQRNPRRGQAGQALEERRFPTHAPRQLGRLRRGRSPASQPAHGWHSLHGGGAGSGGDFRTHQGRASGREATGGRACAGTWIFGTRKCGRQERRHTTATASSGSRVGVAVHRGTMCPITTRGAAFCVLRCRPMVRARRSPGGVRRVRHQGLYAARRAAFVRGTSHSLRRSCGSGSAATWPRERRARSQALWALRPKSA
jgi:hypothetical protein